MGEVVVRQWSERVFAAYIPIEGRLTLVGSEDSRQAAFDFALNVLNDPREVENRCYNSLFTARRRRIERVSVRQLGGAQRERLRRSTAGLDPILNDQEVGPA